MEEELKERCAKVCDDPGEDNGAQGKRIQKCHGVRESTEKEKEGREEDTTVEVLRARGNVHPVKTNGPEDIIVSERFKEAAFSSAGDDRFPV